MRLLYFKIPKRSLKPTGRATRSKHMIICGSRSCFPYYNLINPIERAPPTSPATWKHLTTM